MSWVQLQPVAAQKKSTISVRLMASRGEKGTVVIGIPSAISGTLGFDKFDTAAIFMGEGKFAGKMLVRPAGDFKIKRLQHALTLRMPMPAGVRMRPSVANQAYTKADDGPGFVIDLPDFLKPGAALPPAGPQPASLRLNGVILEMGAKSISLTKTEAALVDRLMKDWGKCVRKEVLHDEIYALDPDGGADVKIIDVVIHNVRKKLRDKQIPLHIETHWGAGYELRRASE